MWMRIWSTFANALFGGFVQILFFFFWSGALSRFTTRKKGLRDEIFQIRRLSNNLRDEIIFRLLSEHLWDETGFLS